MRKLTTIAGSILLVGVLAGCGSSRRAADPTEPSPPAETLAELTRLAASAYAAGDCRASREILQAALEEVTRIGGPNRLSEQIRYLDSAYPLPQGGSYRRIADDCQTATTVLVDANAPAPSSHTVQSVSAPSSPTRTPAPLDTPALIRHEIDRLLEEIEGHPPNRIPDDFVRDIEHYIGLYQNDSRYRSLFERSMRRSRKYVPALRPVFAERGLPDRLILGIATVESGFNPTAVSRVGARGMFQFMPATGRQYKLRVTRTVDERNAPIQSAIACREYLMDLLMEFGDLGLALGAYNGGPGRIRQALRELNDFRDRNFWGLRARTDVLARETQAYVSQIYAVVVLSAPGNARRFGFSEEPYPDPSDYRMLLVPDRMRLAELARAAGTSVDALLELNPDLEPGSSHTPSGVIDYPLFVPAGSERRVMAALNVRSETPTTLASTAPSRSSSTGASDERVTIRYVVRRGNTISNIVEWFGKSSSGLRGWNPYLRNRGLWAGDVVYIRDLNPTWRKIEHSVRRGETLSGIARRYGVPVNDLRGWNGLRSDRINSGSRLIIYTNTGGGRRS